MRGLKASPGLALGRVKVEGGLSGNSVGHAVVLALRLFRPRANVWMAVPEAVICSVGTRGPRGR